MEVRGWEREDEVEGRGKYTEGWTPGWTNDVVALNSPRRGGGCERVGEKSGKVYEAWI